MVSGSVTDCLLRSFTDLKRQTELHYVGWAKKQNELRPNPCHYPWSTTNKINKFSTIMTSPGPAFQECTRSCHENVPAPKAVSSDLQSTDGLTVLARIEIVAILIHYQPFYITSHTQWNPVTHCYSLMSRCAAVFMYLGKSALLKPRNLYYLVRFKTILYRGPY